MKRRKLRKSALAKLVAAGLALSSPALAAPLNSNLAVNPSFEIVDTSDRGPFNAVRLLGWDDVDGDFDDIWAFAYSQNYSGTVPPPGSGEYHFAGGFNTTAGAIDVTQLIDVSDGDTGALIATGQARYDLSAFFSSYQDQDDTMFVRVRFQDGAQNDISTSPMIGGYPFVSTLGFAPGPFGNQRDWGQDSTTGAVPVGTAFVWVDLIPYDADVNHDGYVDLVNFRITAVPEPASIVLLAIAGVPLLMIARRSGRLRRRL